ncbi:MAG: MOSC domain-containing protein [Cytophagales bacterium]|nr:MOSC domain-containing protein [Cytophagales bacterium]
MKVSELNIYPIKSTRQVSLQKSKVLATGLAHDREWLLIDHNQELITARDYPRLLQVRTQVEKNKLKIATPLESFTFQDPEEDPEISFRFFNEQLCGKIYSRAANQWFSDYLGITCQVIHQKEVFRPMLEKRGGKAGDQVNYGDEAPILLIGQGSLDDLNSRLESPVTMGHFRPNIVINDAKPYEEDQWKRIRIGVCEFDVAQVCRRCVFTTIDPITQEKNKRGEPLRTLAGYRKVADGGVAFGMHLIPRKLGEIQKGNEVIVVK